MGKNFPTAEILGNFQFKTGVRHVYYNCHHRTGYHFFVRAALRVLNEYERGVVFRLGRVIKAKGPGLIILIPVVDKMVKISMRLVAMDVDPQDVITRDNESVSSGFEERPSALRSVRGGLIMPKASRLRHSSFSYDG